MALTKKVIKLTNTNVDSMYLDPQNVLSSENKISGDLQNIINDLNRIEKIFKTFKNDKSTKGDWDDIANSCIKKSNKYETKLRTDKDNLDKAILKCVLEYVLIGDSAQQAAKVADTIDVG